jgi:ubiquinone/menaquinone biosynthesis C-methylase UbiE
MKRRPTVELLDSDSGTPEEVAGSIRDLQSFNTRLGGINTTRELIQSVAQRNGAREFTLLEVASGSGFVPLQAGQQLAATGITVRPTLLDRAASHLPKNGSDPKLVGDALRLPFADSSFDLVSCSLFLHHLSPEQVVSFAQESLRVSRMAVLVNDLIRHPLHLALAYLGVPLYRSRLTRHDAPASVRQAYTIPEVKQFMIQGGATSVEIQKHYLYRMGVIAWK